MRRQDSTPAEQFSRDPLTGVFNRRHMIESLERELQQATLRSYSIGFIMLDIDHFRRVNKAFGHAAGNLMLPVVSDLLRSHISPIDILCRFGGDEFFIILPETTLEITDQRAKDLLESARHLQVNYEGQELGPISFSAGVAAFPNHGESLAALLNAADRALFRAKREGRDRVVIAEMVP